MMLRRQHSARYPVAVPRPRRLAQPDLDELHLAAWRAFLTAHAAAVGRIEHELARADGDVVPLNWYDVLIELLEAPDHRLRQRDLAASVVLTRSGISRLIDRLEAAGLARREPNPADRRGDLIMLTELGRAAVRRTWPVYARSIAEHFARYVRADEARLLTAALERVRATELPSSTGPIDSIAS
jgi:DNA-binding MarR family transcriptional regulator